MFRFVKITILFILLSSLIIENGKADSSDTEFKYYNGLLSDILRVNNIDNLSITPKCNKQLSSVQNSLNIKSIWAIKRKSLID